MVLLGDLVSDKAPEMTVEEAIETLDSCYTPTLLEIAKNETDADYQTIADLAVVRSENADQAERLYPAWPKG